MGGFRRFIRIVWTLCAIIALGSVILIMAPSSAIGPFGLSILTTGFGFYFVFVVLCLLLIAVIVLLIQGIFARSKRREVTIKNEHGSLTIRSTALESTVTRTAQSFRGVADTDVTVSMYNQPEDTKVTIIAYVEPDTRDLTGLSERIQRAVQQTVETTLGVPLETVHVTVTKQPESERETRTPRRHKQPRVK